MPLFYQPSERRYFTFWIRSLEAFPDSRLLREYTHLFAFLDSQEVVLFPSLGSLREATAETVLNSNGTEHLAIKYLRAKSTLHDFQPGL
jgi:hypothetical protein